MVRLFLFIVMVWAEAEATALEHLNLLIFELFLAFIERHVLAFFSIGIVLTFGLIVLLFSIFFCFLLIDYPFGLLDIGLLLLVCVVLIYFGALLRRSTLASLSAQS